MQNWTVDGMWRAQPVYRNKDGLFRYDFVIAGITEDHGGMVLGTANCVHNGLRLMGLGFPTQEQQRAACETIHRRYPEIEFAGPGQSIINECDCEACPLLDKCGEVCDSEVVG